MRIRRLHLILALCGLVLLNGAVWHAVLLPRGVQVLPLAVEKGTAVLVISPTGTRVLLGASADASVLRGLGTALLPWRRSLTALVVPSLSEDFAGGAPLLFPRYRVLLLARSAFPGTAAAERTFAGAAREAGLRPVTLSPETKLFIGDGAVITFSSAPHGLSATLEYGATHVVLASTTPKGLYTKQGDLVR